MPKPEEVIAGIVTEGYNEHIRLHGPGGDIAEAAGDSVAVRRRGMWFYATFRQRTDTLAGDSGLSESQHFQIREARDLLARWDARHPARHVGSENTLADHLRNVLAMLPGDQREGN